MNEHTSKGIINGIDFQKLKESIKVFGATPSLAEFKFRLANEWLGAGHNKSTEKASYGLGQEFPEREGKFTMLADEPAILLSGDKGANPVEHLLHALASCVTTTAVYHAAARNIPLKSVDSSLEGDINLRGFLGLDPNVPKGYKQIKLIMRVTGDLSEEQKKEIVHLGCEFSPVFNMVSKAVPITVEVK